MLHKKYMNFINLDDVSGDIQNTVDMDAEAGVKYSPSENPNLLSLTHPQTNTNISLDFTQKSTTQIDEISKMLDIHNPIKEKLDRFLATKKIPHIIFHGSSGAGKMTLVYEFIKKIYGGNRQYIKSNVMIVNCSHGKGIKFIREELKFFAKTNIQTNTDVPFKTILLLNAHHLTIDAQSALRRCIELFSYNTRFFIIVENKNQLLNPILSRFCYIYVPEYYSENEIVNLYQYKRPDYIEIMKSEKQKLLAKKLGNMDLRSVKPIDLMDYSNELYEEGISCLDFIEWMETQKSQWTASSFSEFMMKYHQMKTNFRCEKLLLFAMLARTTTLDAV